MEDLVSVVRSIVRFGSCGGVVACERGMRVDGAPGFYMRVI